MCVYIHAYTCIYMTYSSFYWQHESIDTSHKVCARVRVCVCTYACGCRSVSIDVLVCLCVCENLYMCRCMYVLGIASCKIVQNCVIQPKVCLYLFLYIYMYTYIYTHAHTHVYTHRLHVFARLCRIVSSKLRSAREY